MRARAIVLADRRCGRRCNTAILVDGGDQFQGTLFYPQYKRTMTAKFTTKLGYDAMTVGNHEFGDGPEVRCGFMDAVQFRVLKSNANFPGEPLLAGKLRKSEGIATGGRKAWLDRPDPAEDGPTGKPQKNVIFTDPIRSGLCRPGSRR